MITDRQMQTVLKGGIPFVIHLNDGRTFAVAEASRVTLGSGSVIVVDAEGTPHFLLISTIHTVTFDNSSR